MSTRPRSTFWLLGRALLPSPASATGCILGAIFLVCGGTLLASFNVGTFLPNLFEGTWATAYTNTIVQPFESITNSQTWSNAAVVVLWGITGLLVYSLIEELAQIGHDWYEATKDVEFRGSTSIRRTHVKEFLTRLLWRLLVVAGAITLMVLLHPLLLYIFRTEHAFVLGMPLLSALKQLVYVLAIWVLLLHICLVLIRLFVFRTRLFGDDRLL